MRNLFHYWIGEISPENCDKIIEDCKKVEAQKGVTFNNTVPTKERNSTIRWVQDVPGIVNLIWPYVNAANRSSFAFDIQGIFEVQFTEYNGADKEHYSWHNDVELPPSYEYSRKLSFVLQLSDPNEYVGGELQGESFNIPEEFKQRGSIIIFPSFLNHQVTPVTEGTRYSLVTWVEGPHWK